MSSREYLQLTEYASKYCVSISTLRRRIKSEEIPYEFKDGKYFLLDQPVSTHQQRSVSPSLRTKRDDSMMSAQKSLQFEEMRTSESRSFESRNSDSRSSDSRSSETSLGYNGNREISEPEPILSTANRLLTELKKAYTQILQEKEDLILHLREEVSDLRTLARVLEEENERLKQNSRRNVES